MKNNLAALNNYLFEAIERINDDSLDDEALERELKRADGVAKLGGQIIQNAQLSLRAVEFAVNNGYVIGESAADILPGMIGNGQEV